MEGIWRIRPAAAPICGVIHVPGDKSISHRALIYAAIAEGESLLRGCLWGADNRATARALQSMGVAIELADGGDAADAGGDGGVAGRVRLRVRGVGLHGLGAPQQPLDMGNSGTAMRLLAGLLCAQPFASTLCGDASLSGRPMGRILEPLAQMGARICSEEGRPPLHLHPASGLRAIDYRLPMASAQVKSCLMLAALYADGETRIDGVGATRDHSERLLPVFGGALQCGDDSLSVRGMAGGGAALSGADVQIPADISSAAFPLVAATLCAGSHLRLPAVGTNPTRDGILDVLGRMGARITRHNLQQLGGEPVAELQVRHAPLVATRILDEEIPRLIDELPVIFVAAARALGTTHISGIAELRVKESDRLAAMAEALEILGVKVRTGNDHISITGAPEFASGGRRVRARGDHRIAMSMAVAALVGTGELSIEGCAQVDTSFPGFLRAMGISHGDRSPCYTVS